MRLISDCNAVLLSLSISFLDERSPKLVWFLPIVTEHEVLASVSRQTVVNHNFLPLPENGILVKYKFLESGGRYECLSS